MDFSGMIEQCAPEVAPHILERIIKVESSHNPYAIGVVGGRLARQPKNKDEATVTARALHKDGWNFSMGLGQINRYNLAKYGLDYESVFEPCHNLRVAAGIYTECLQRALPRFSPREAALAAFSCYYSGNFRRGFQSDGAGKGSYVQRITAALPTTDNLEPIEVIPSNKGNVPSAARIKKSGTTKDEARISRLPSSTKRSEVKELRGE